MESLLILAWPCGHEAKPDEGRCMDCYRADLYGNGPQGDKVKLFEPAPNQMPGQLNF